MKNILKLEDFFSEESLELKVIEKTAEKHDREIAYVQGLSHFVGSSFG
jgi:prephenate dehydrogenase